MAQTAKARIAPATFTTEEAVKRHRGVDRTMVVRMCNRGEYLRLKYGGREKIPLAEIRRKPTLFAVKVGRCWQIPVQELDRVFLGK